MNLHINTYYIYNYTYQYTYVCVQGIINCCCMMTEE